MIQPRSKERRSTEATMMKSRRIWTRSSISYTEKIEVSMRGLLSITAALETQEDEEADEEDSYPSYDP